MNYSPFFRSSEDSSDTDSASGSSSGDEKTDRHASGRKTLADNEARRNLGMLFIEFL